MAETEKTMKRWKEHHQRLLFTAYSISLFSVALLLIYRAIQIDGLALHGISGLLVAAGTYVLAVFIILLGFPTPKFAHISLDRITQVGLILMFGPVISALVNGLASFTYPLLKMRRQLGLRMALVRSMHNSAMFVIIIYFSGKAYLLCNGPVPAGDLDLRVASAFAALILAMQVLNGIFLRVRDFVISAPDRGGPDWYAHSIEIPVAAVGLITAIIYNTQSAAVFIVYLMIIIGMILIAKSLNEVTIALKQRVKHVVTINRIANAISSEVRLEHLTAVVHQECMRQVKATNFDFCAFDNSTGQEEFMHAGENRALVSVDTPGPGLLELMRHAMRHQTVVNLASWNDYPADLEHLFDPYHPAQGSVICVPIQYNRDAIGAICVSSDTERAFTHHHLKLLQAISRQVSSALKNVSLISDLEARKNSLEQKVSERVAEIEMQGRALAAANARQEKLLISLRATTDKLEQQNREDALTGLYNRRHMDEFLAREHARASRHGAALTVALMDVDHFKAVNDNFSHQVGDATLKALGKILPRQVRALDMVARYGGEEIFLCFPDTNLDQAMLVCERARAAIENHNWSDIAPGLAVTVSFGVAQKASENTEQLLIRCDQQLYRAKNSGRNKVCG